MPVFDRIRGPGHCGLCGRSGRSGDSLAGTGRHSAWKPARGYNAGAVKEKRAGRTIAIRLYGKPDCCLCDRAYEVLRVLSGEFPLSVEKIDVSNSPELLARYGNDIPVAIFHGRELFRHRADLISLRAFLRAL